VISIPQIQNGFRKYSISVGYAPNTTARNIRFIKTFLQSKQNGVETHHQLDVSKQ
jgi:hypothetical protein